MSGLYQGSDVNFSRGVTCNRHNEKINGKFSETFNGGRSPNLQGETCERNYTGLPQVTMLDVP